MIADATGPVAPDNVFSQDIFVHNNLLIEWRISTDIEVRAFLAEFTNNIWDYKNQTWLQAFLGLLGEFFAMDHPQEIRFNLVCFLLEGIIQTKNVRGDELREF